jgi:hypothetical protein
MKTGLYNCGWKVAFFFLSTGAALVLAILTGVPLWLTSLGVLFFGACVAIYGWRYSNLEVRRIFRKRIAAGFIGGIAATVAYDVSRYLIVLYFHLNYRPFEAIPLFGKLLVGQWMEGGGVLWAGRGFHIANGVGFGVAYTILFGRVGVWAGVAWGFALEMAMLSIYPGWLKIQFVDEFLGASLVGHVAYGSVLGMTSKRLLDRWES